MFYSFFVDLEGLFWADPNIYYRTLECTIQVQQKKSKQK